jgi:hypothetical protein
VLVDTKLSCQWIEPFCALSEPIMIFEPNDRR